MVGLSLSSRSCRPGRDRTAPRRRPPERHGARPNLAPGSVAPFGVLAPRYDAPLRLVPPSSPNILRRGGPFHSAREPQELQGSAGRLERPRGQLARSPAVTGATAPPVDRRARGLRLQRPGGGIEVSFCGVRCSVHLI